MRYGEAVEALQARGRFGVHLGLGRTRALLRELGDPHRHLRGALIGGTNGKGSVQALVGAVLLASGLHVGQTPKPHLVSYRERIAVDGQPIAPADFAELMQTVLEAAERVRGRAGPPTEFEVVTAAAFAWFARAEVDCCVIEVGMGGRLDATNTWDGGVSAITNVDRDHMEYLGATVSLIAREKAAIIKRGDLAVTAAAGEALEVLRRRAGRLGVPLREVTPTPVVAMDRAGLVVRDPIHGELRVGLVGRHQAANVAVAIGVLEALASRGVFTLETEALRRGCGAAHWPGRMELLSLVGLDRAVAAPTDRPDPAGPDLLLDGAHNAGGALALARAFEELRRDLSAGRPTLLVGVLRDKELQPMLEALATSPALAGSRLVATRVPGTARALPAADVAAAWSATRAAPSPQAPVKGEPSRLGLAGGGDAAVPSRRAAEPPVAFESVDEALAYAVSSARAEGGPLVVAGSLYLVGHVRGKLFDDPTLRDPEP